MKRRLLFYTAALAGGGAERVWAVIASALARRGHEVTFAVDFPAEENLAYLDPAIPLRVVGRHHGLAVLRLARLMRRERYDLVLSAVGGSDVKAMLAGLLAFRRDRVVASFHGHYENENGRLGRFKYERARLFTWMSAASICVSEGLRRDVIEHWHAHPERCVRIYNPILVDGVPEPLGPAELAARDEIVLAVGRLVPEKGFSTLVRAFARLERPRARLVILGQGPQRAALEAEAHALGVGDRVEFPGYAPHPWTWYARARCFVLSSRIEAFGNVVVEALGHGLPVVATDCAGPSEIIADPRHGTIVPKNDETAMAAAIEAALAAPGDPAPRQTRAAQFSVEESANRYEDLIERLLAARE